MTLKEWMAAGTPTAQSVARTPHDLIWQSGSPDIFYEGAIKSGRPSYGEWRAMGGPSPVGYVDDSSLRRCRESELVPGRNDVP